MDKKQPQDQIQGNLNLSVDTTPVLFTDMAIWNISPDAVVINLGQSILGNPAQVKIVARIGLTRDHAIRFVNGLTKDLALTQGQGQTNNAKS